MMKVKIKRVDKSLPLPVYQTGGSVGCDIYARVTTNIAPGALAKIPGNVIVEIPKGYMGMLVSRSSTPFKKGLSKPNGFGVMDQDFCGPEDEYNVLVYNFTDQEVMVERGERVAQLVLVPVEIAEWEEVDSMEHNSTRGGVGSTGGHNG
jgi:dUTP pyrophosphatase